MKKTFAVRGSIYKCIVPALLLLFALYTVLSSSASVSTGGNINISIFDLVKRLAGVI